jgi:hypothetical protein
MYACLSLYFIHAGAINSGNIGAIIFLSGMAIEALVCLVEGRKLLKKLPIQKADHEIRTKSHIMRFYTPLIWTSLFAIIVPPAINAALGRTVNIELSIASYAIAASVTQLIVSFFSYIHQIVLNFYRIDPVKVRKFVMLLSFIPPLLLSLISFTPLGQWFLIQVIGINGELLTSTIQALRIFILLTIALPWLDYGNGLLMLRGQTKFMISSQAANVFITILILTSLTLLVPDLNARIGALAQSLGVIAELAVVAYVIKHSSSMTNRLLQKN